MACPNLERLGGTHTLYGHEFDRLTHAMSTRKMLREHVWLIGENEAVTERSYYQLAPGLMDIYQKFLFVSFHNQWCVTPSPLHVRWPIDSRSVLTTLLLHSPREGILERDILVKPVNVANVRGDRDFGVLQYLPALQNLCISSFDMDDFDDSTLQLLPALQSLRLQDLEGVTFWGLSEFSRTKSAFALRRLSLINLDVLYISAISSLLLRLKNLKKFTLKQDSSPEIPVEEVVMHPVVSKSSLFYD